ncbi:MAG: Bug family tripartite tricarboxylate transporter substrate binding protein [Inquilinaceae bacterium]
MKKTALTATMMAVASFAVPAVAQDCGWAPDRAVTYVVPWSPGGGTDANSRALAAILEADLGVPFNVVNRTGGNGVTGHTAIATAEPDGYTIGSVTVEIATMHHAGLTELTVENVTPIALIDIVPAAVTVKADSQFGTLNDLLDYAKANPGELTASGTAQGGIWHLALAGLLNAEGIDPAAIRWIPSQGAGPAMQELLAGGVDLVTPALSESKGIIDAGEAKALAYMYDSRMEALPEVPTVQEATGTDWTLAAFISVGGPEGLPEEMVCAYSQAVERATQTQEWADFKAGRGSDVVFEGPEALTQRIVAADQSLGETMAAIGLAK